MYDHLDDPSPPGPRPTAQDLVTLRASKLRRRRLMALGGSGAALVALVAVALLSLSGSGSHRATLIIATPSPTTSVGPTPSCTTPASCPGFAASPTGVPTIVPTRSVVTPFPSVTTATCSASDRASGNCPDGRPGWHSTVDACEPAVVPAGDASQPPVEGITARLEAPSGVSAGQPVKAVVTITNSSSVTVTFTLQRPREREALQAGVAGPGGTSGAHLFDSDGAGLWTLRPGESGSVPAEAATSQCGDTSKDTEGPLPAGHYRFGVTVSYVEAVREQAASATPDPSPTATEVPVRSHGSWSLVLPVTVT